MLDKKNKRETGSIPLPDLLHLLLPSAVLLDWQNHITFLFAQEHRRNKIFVLQLGSLIKKTKS
jgi:hypothetical protein